MGGSFKVKEEIGELLIGKTKRINKDYQLRHSGFALS